MADDSVDPASFWTQANALLRKNLTYQKRNMMTNVRLILFPFLLCLLLVLIQSLIDNELDKPKFRCGCACIDTNGDGRCEEVCGVQFSTLEQASSCPIESPPEWPPLLQMPAPEFRAVRTNFNPFIDLPDESCRRTGTCPATVLVTGTNQSLGEILVGTMFTNSLNLNSNNVSDSLAFNVLGSSTMTENNNFLEPAIVSNLPLYNVQRQCTGNSSLTVSIPLLSVEKPQEVRCAQGIHLWRNSASEVNDELYKGFHKGNSEGKVNEILAGFDFLNSNANNFNVSVWYNSSLKNDTANLPSALLRVPRSVNLATNAYLKFLQRPGTEILFEFVKEMPKQASKLKLDLASLLGGLFFTWVVLQLFPVVLTTLVYEKQQKLRIMMKMHGLGDGPYWLISYAYFLTISAIYMLCFVIFGSVIGLKFFTMNDYSIQFVFYFLYINLQISLAFLTAAWFSNVKTASVIAYILVFGTGLLGGFLFQFFLEDPSFPNAWIIVLELFPGFALYRGLYEFSQYSFNGNSMGTDGMRWGNLRDEFNGMRDVMIIMVVEWLLVFLVAYYVDQISSSGGGKSPLFFLKRFQKKAAASFRLPSLRKQGSKVFVQMEQPDVIQEREKVEQLLLEPDASHAIVCDNLKKVYPGRDGNPEKFAVKGLSLAVARGECFGMLGPNGAGKTSFISMMIGLTKPSAGTALVQGMDIRNDMDRIYTNMGVCPQHDLLWEQLTGREHLLFYGRLKNLRGSVLTEAVDESLKGVNLYHGGVADKQAGKYSGGMKRRLSVAISLIGDPKVVYMDEPSTGLDPASRNSLWNVVKRAKQDRAIILTTHSMEEAEVLCDRLGIFVDGSLQCIGNPKELKGRYGGSYVFTMTTSANNDVDVENMVKHLSPGATKIYHISGTQKFELPKDEVRIGDVFKAVEDAKRKLSDIVLSFSSVDDFRNDTTYFGNIVGRVANRIGGAQFGINGVFYKLVPNDGKNLLHGGKIGFGDVVWKVGSYLKDSHITFTYDSFDGEQGFPGDLSVSVTYMLIEKNKLGVKMVARALNKPTPVNIAQHSYWNLDGHSSGDILSHKIKLFASQITPVDSELIPTGKMDAVEGTPYDFRTARQIGSQINDIPGGVGYDINYVVEDSGRKQHLRKVAEVEGNVSGRKMEVWSNQGGVQFYTGGQLKDVKGKDGAVYKKFGGMCLETQGFPDSVNHPNFPSQILNPGETYMHVMVYRFTV